MSYYIVERRQYLGDAQTKCTRHRPWCGGDIDALGLGAAGSYATLGAKAATHHGRRIFLAYSVAELGLIPYVGCYVGTVWQRETKISRVTIGFKLVPDAAIWWCLWTGGGGVLTRLWVLKRPPIFSDARRHVRNFYAKKP